MSARQKRIGIIGFGEMGKLHGLEFRHATQGLIEIAGVVEPSDTMYRKGCEWNKIRAQRFASADEMLQKCKLDGAIISSPNHTHLENLRAFKGQTIPIMIEKPLDTSMENVSEVARFAAAYSGKLLRKPPMTST